MINKREFFKLLFTGCAVSITPFATNKVLSNHKVNCNNVNGILVDTTRCVGCMECERVCAEKWGFPQSDDHNLSAYKCTTIKEVGETFIPFLCMHCNNPTCVSVCPVGALEKTPEGPVIYHAEKCIGCRYCMQACPFKIPKYEWDQVNPKIKKCNMCYEFVSKGGIPKCVENCPAEARVFGLRNDLIIEAKQRIKEEPSGYLDYIYGEYEVGGTSTLYLSKLPFKELGLKDDLPKYELPPLTWNVLSKIPSFVLWGAVTLFGLNWLNDRKDQVKEDNKHF